MQRRWLPYPILNGCSSPRTTGLTQGSQVRCATDDSIGTMALDDLDQLPFSPYRDHLKSCNDCQTSLWQFFDIRFTGRIWSRCDQTTVWASLKITCREEVGQSLQVGSASFFPMRLQHEKRTRVEIETEIVARVKKEMDEPRLTESVRNGFTAQAAPAAPWASHGNVKTHFC